MTVARHAQAVLQPFLLACDTKSAKLANFALACLQRLLTRHELSGEALLVIIRALEVVGYHRSSASCPCRRD